MMAAICFVVALGYWALWVFGRANTPLQNQTFCIVVALWTIAGMIVTTLNRRSAK